MAALGLTGGAVNVAAAEELGSNELLRRMEYLDRGLVAVKVGSGVYLSWRFLGDESEATTFRVYRDDIAVADVADSTNYSDTVGTPTSSYSVAAVVDGVEGERSAELTPRS
ncbi:hypothetical protein E1218_33725 [Kribbella turkmenica]|uniref:Rhamnogalacturonan I lyase beta-sheet domain-containing protein n=1 Tax=Kribbella turkmenica TaxID=2530375 RepID=A0A4R4W5S0_9ACTN|nr:hypothetical protein [Kribbella turkmenica]TDD13979.1 hypothetical protein E1218_33725 [Kribbella turkmenica]